MTIATVYLISFIILVSLSLLVVIKKEKMAAIPVPVRVERRKQQAHRIQD